MKKTIFSVFVLFCFYSSLFSQQMFNVKAVEVDTIDEEVDYWIYSSLGDTIPIKVHNSLSENLLTGSTQIYVSDSFFVVVTVEYHRNRLQNLYKFQKNFIISAGFKLKGEWIQDYRSCELPYLKGGFTESYLDTVAIINASLLRVEYDFINYLNDEKIRNETEIVIGAQGFFDRKERRSLTTRWSIENNYYLTNSPRVPIFELESWDEKRLKEAIRFDSIWVEEFLRENDKK